MKPTPPNAAAVRTPRAQRIDDFKRRSLPAIVWGLCAVVVIGLLWGKAQSFQYVGLAQASEYEISAHTAGTVDTVIVELFDQVRAGDIVAKLDDRGLLAAIQTSQATVEQLQAELEAARTRLVDEKGRGASDWSSEFRRFKMDEEDRQLESLGLRVVIEGDEIEKERLSLELRRLAPLLQEGIIGQQEFDNTRLLHDQLKQRIEANRLLLDQTEREYEDARTRRREYEEHLPEDHEIEPLLAPIVQSVAVEANRLREIEVERASLILRSPVDGQVSQVLCRRGQSVVPGEPIVMIAENQVREIVAYLNATDSARVEQNSSVRVTRRGPKQVVTESVVLRVGPTVQPLPQRLWRNPRIADYGRAVVISSSPALELVPGEIVEVQFD